MQSALLRPIFKLPRSHSDPHDAHTHAALPTVGMVGISDVEGRTQFSLWCILAAPLFLGTDVRNASAYTMATIGNVEAIAINQDALGIQGFALAPSYAPASYNGGILLNISACAAAPKPPTAWSLTADGHLASAAGQCLTVFACNTAPGSLVFGYDCITNACGNELWKWSGPAGGGRVQSAETGAGAACLTASSDPSAESALVIEPCAGAGAANQTWAIDAASGALSLPLAAPPACVWYPAPPPVDLYAKPLSAPPGGAQPIALAVLNRNKDDAPAQTVDLTALGFAPAQQVTVRDIWADTTSAPVSGSFETRPIASHETLLLKITPVE